MTPGRTNGTCLTLATLIRTAYGAGLVDVCPEYPNLLEPCMRSGLPDPRTFSGIAAMDFNMGTSLASRMASA